ncbi:MAG: hypothetical protein LC620_08535, partial [Halobacteriales archaeon]|nr:hypothetical protein [Halobacteriales archaeon]
MPEFGDVVGLLHGLAVTSACILAAVAMAMPAAAVLPPSPTVTTLPQPLSVAADEYSAVWGNGGIYVFGGGEPAPSAAIQRYV